MTTTSTGYVTVSLESDAWGHDVSETDARQYAQLIIDACEKAGIDCYCDVRPCEYDDNGDELQEIDWFGEWVTAGHEWDSEKWAAWFAK